jgi:hypothetical protein
MPFCQLVIPSACHSVTLPFCQLAILSPFCQLAILSPCHFISLQFCQLAIFSACILPTFPYFNLTLCQCANLSACHRVNLYHQFDETSIVQNGKWMKWRMDEMANG